METLLIPIEYRAGRNAGITGPVDRRTNGLWQSGKEPARTV